MHKVEEVEVDILQRVETQQPCNDETVQIDDELDDHKQIVVVSIIIDEMQQFHDDMHDKMEFAICFDEVDEEFERLYLICEWQIVIKRQVMQIQHDEDELQLAFDEHCVVFEVEVDGTLVEFDDLAFDDDNKQQVQIDIVEVQIHDDDEVEEDQLLIESIEHEDPVDLDSLLFVIRKIVVIE